MFVLRPRLHRILDESATRPLTVLVAPAGSGKTATLAEWATAVTQREVRWYDARSTDSATDLAAALVSCVRTSEPTEPVHVEDVRQVLAHGSGEPDVLVIDDAHLLSPPAWALLEAVLTAVPDRVHVMLSTRRDVPLAMVALELTDAVTTVRVDALRFTDAEAAVLVTAHAPDATSEDFLTLQTRARGWAAALVVGARTLGGATDRLTARAGLARTEQPVLDYLLGEVFTTLPTATRHVLLSTCDEDPVSDEASVVLSGDPDAPDRLAGLAADGLLVIQYRAGRPPGTRSWRHHPLLRELLRRQVAHDGPNHALALAAHHRAARHYALRGPVTEAFRHAAAAHDPQLLSGLLIEHAPTLIASGREDLLSTALRALPEQDIAQDPALLAVITLERRSAGDFEAAMHATIQVRDAADRRRPYLSAHQPPCTADVALAADAALLRIWQARLGCSALTEAIDEVRSVLGCRPGQHNDDVVGRAEHHPSWPMAPARVAWLLLELSSTEIWVGDLVSATAHVGEVLVIARTLGYHRLLAAALSNQALLEALDARFQTAKATAAAAQEAAEHGGGHGDGYPARAHLASGLAAFVELDLTAAAATLELVDSMEAGAPDPLVKTLALILRGCLRAEAGDLDGARRLLASAPPAGPLPAILVWLLATARTGWALVAGDLQEARQQMQRMSETGVAPGGETVFNAILTDLGGDPESALEQLEGVLATPAQAQMQVCRATAAAYKTRLLLRAGNVADARDTLRDALTLVSAQRILHPLFGAAAPGFSELLREVATGLSPHPFAGAALEVLRDHHSSYGDLSNRLPVPQSRGALVHGPALPVQAVPDRRHLSTVGSLSTPENTRALSGLPGVRLTVREADVLRELALGGSYADIARALYITENTVKTHLAVLYRKLGVNRRAAALHRARDMGLIRADV